MIQIEANTVTHFSMCAAFLVVKEGVSTLIDAIAGRLPKSGVQGVHSL